jgi:hypothetical protein
LKEGELFFETRILWGHENKELLWLRKASDTMTVFGGGEDVLRSLSSGKHKQLRV